MYPKPEDELRGWNVHALEVGNVHNVVHADDVTIAWGSGTACGELGIGEGRKSSASPAKVDSLDGVSVAQVACGAASTFLLVEASETVQALPEFEPKERAAGEEEEEAPKKGKGKAAGKRPAQPAPKGKAKKAKK